MHSSSVVSESVSQSNDGDGDEEEEEEEEDAGKYARVDHRTWRRLLQPSCPLAILSLDNDQRREPAGSYTRTQSTLNVAMKAEVSAANRRAH